jgi:general secretion pathway protein L
VLTSTFVKVQVVVDAPLQMARELAALQRASGQASGRDLEAMLGAYAALAPNQAAPEAIDYSAGELRIKGIALQPDELASLSLRLKARGYVALTDATGLVIRSGSER